MTDKDKGELRAALLEIGAIIPQTDAEVAIYEETNTKADVETDEELMDLDYVLNRGQHLDTSTKSIFEAQHSQHTGFSMAAREGKDIPEDIRNRMKDARDKAKNDI